MSEVDLNKIILDSVGYDVPPVYQYYNTKKEDDYSEVTGYVIQWPNGLQIITGKYSFNSVSFSAFTGKWGKFYESTKQYMPHYEVPFKTKPTVIHNIIRKNNGSAAFISKLFNSSTSDMGRCYVVRPVSGSKTVDMGFVAIGNWTQYLGGNMNRVDKIIKNNVDIYICPEVTDNTVSNGKDKVIKFQNGMMIITGTRNLGSIAMTSTWGSFYESGEINLGTFSESFIESPTVLASITNNSTECLLQQVNSTTNTSIGASWALSGTSKTGTVEIDYVAIGRWK